MAKRKVGKKHHLVVSNDKNPKVKLKPGQKLEVVTVAFVDEEMKPQRIAARLCDGGGTCVAIIDTSED